MCKPKIIKIKLSTILGIMTFRPDKAAIDVITIGPKNQAKGISKCCAKIALGIEIEITATNFFEKSCFIFTI